MRDADRTPPAQATRPRSPEEPEVFGLLTPRRRGSGGRAAVAPQGDAVLPEELPRGRPPPPDFDGPVTKLGARRLKCRASGRESTIVPSKSQTASLKGMERPRADASIVMSGADASDSPVPRRHHRSFDEGRIDLASTNSRVSKIVRRSGSCVDASTLNSRAPAA